MYLRKRCQECCEYQSMMDFKSDPDHFDGKSKICNHCIEKKQDQEENVEKEIEHIVDEDSGEIIEIERTINVKKFIQQINKKTGEVINEFKTPKDAGEFIGRDPKSIRNVIAGRSKSAYGFFWKFKII